MIKSIFELCKPTELVTVKQIHRLNQEIRSLKNSFMQNPTISKEIMLNLANAYLASYKPYPLDTKKDLMNHYLTFAQVLDVEERRLRFESFEDFCYAVKENDVLYSSIGSLVDDAFLINTDLFSAVEIATNGFFLDVMEQRLELYAAHYCNFM